MQQNPFLHYNSNCSWIALCIISYFEGYLLSIFSCCIFFFTNKMCLPQINASFFSPFLFSSSERQRHIENKRRPQFLSLPLTGFSVVYRSIWSWIGWKKKWKEIQMEKPDGCFSHTHMHFVLYTKVTNNNEVLLSDIRGIFITQICHLQC